MEYRRNVVAVYKNFALVGCYNSEQQVSYGCLIHKSYGNLLAVGRCASATGYGWDILRVIPPAIVTGQAAGQAASYALDDSKAVTDICVSKLQRELGWEPSLQFEEGIEKTVRWYLDNQEWMDNVTSGEYGKYYDSMYKGR